MSHSVFRFLTAKLYDYEEEMLRVYLENEDAWGKKQIDFDDVMLVAKLLARDGKDSLAWGVISRKLKTWQPYEYHEVEPIGLLNDDVLFNVMTPERCEVVLLTKYENKLEDLWWLHLSNNYMTVLLLSSVVSNIFRGNKYYCHISRKQELQDSQY